MSLIVHRGGWSATKADLAAVPVPQATESYHSVPYGRFVEEVELHIPRFGLTVSSDSSPSHEKVDRCSGSCGSRG